MDDTTSPSRVPPSGRFVLRIEPGLHAALREAARSLGVSLNDYCARKLAAPASAAPAPAAEVVRRAASVLGDALLGVVAFGSWARQEQRDGSDVDVLLVADSGAALSRELYRRWDAQPLTWERHPVEPHFVHMPAPGARISGLWAEAAVEGVVLFDMDLSLSRRLVEIRCRIVAGEVLRREVHGQPYWIGPP
jgi:hypothetical protein